MECQGSIECPSRNSHQTKLWNLHGEHYGFAVRLGAGLFGAIAMLTTPEFATDGATASAQQSSKLGDDLFGFQEALNLVSFFSAEVLVHLATWTWRFEWP